MVFAPRNIDNSVQDMGTMELQEIWIDPNLTRPPILISTLISSIILAFLTIRLVILLKRLRLQSTQDRIAKFLVISSFPVSYILIGVFQIWFGGLLYRDYIEMDPGSNVHIGVPVYPVWFVGILSAVIYIIICRHRTGTAKPKKQQS
jgi:hypothetical protein